MKYFLIIDPDTQWFSYAAKCEKYPYSPNSFWVKEAIDIDGAIGELSFIHKICQEERDINNVYFCGAVYNTNYCGWQICEHTFAKIKRINELAPLVAEYQKLVL